MVVLTNASRESTRRPLTAFDRIMGQLSPLPESETSHIELADPADRNVAGSSSSLPPWWPSSTPQNPASRLNSESDQPVPDMVQQTASEYASDIVRNLAQEELLSNGAFQFTRALLASESANYRARELRPQARPTWCLPFPRGSDVSLDTLIHTRVMSVYPRLPRDPTIPKFQYCPKTFRPWRLTFRQACSVMFHFESPANGDLIVKTILGHSLLIHGIPADCPEEDLWLAVYFLIEEHFCLQAELEYCSRNISGQKDPTVVGVVLKSMNMKTDIWRMRNVLDPTRYRLEPNLDLFWIANLCRATKIMRN